MEETLFQKITAHRALHKESRIILGVLLGEISRDPDLNKSGDPKNPSDADCIRIIKKMIDNNKEVNTPETIQENALLSIFLPKQLDILEITNIIKSNDFSSIKDCMEFFKANHAGLYNGKDVSSAFQKMQK